MENTSLLLLIGTVFQRLFLHVFWTYIKKGMMSFCLGIGQKVNQGIRSAIPLSTIFVQ